MDSNFYQTLTNKAKTQLGMNPSTARHQLNRDVIYHLLVETGRTHCLRCAEELSKETWSVEHLEEWLDSEDPSATFFDIKNIAFVCKTCNVTYNRGRIDVKASGITLVKPVSFIQPLLGEYTKPVVPCWDNPCFFFVKLLKEFVV